jgi:hypothetical protein
MAWYLYFLLQSSIFTFRELEMDFVTLVMDVDLTETIHV